MLKNRQIMKTIFISLASLLFFSACEIGLGEALDMEGPSVTLNAPNATAIVQREFVVAGSVTDNEGVVELTVSLSAVDFETLYYKWNGSWKILEGGQWKEYSAATAEGTPKDMDWTLSVSIPGTFDKKDFTLTTVAKDAAGSESKNSRDERLITVEGCEPSASVTVGKALFTSLEEAKNVFNLDTVPESRLLKNNSVLDKLMCSDFTMRVAQKENTRLGKFILVLDEVKDINDGSVTVIPTIEEIPDLLSLQHDFVWTTESSKRSFEVPVNKANLPSSLQSGKHLLRVITESFDEGGNIERKLQGFFIYYDEADKPWTEMALGDSVYIDGEDQKAVYPSCLLQGNAYDNDGLKSIEMELWVFENSVWKKKDGINPIDLTDDEFPKNKIWSLNAITDAKHFKVVSRCTDIKGNVSDTCEKYFRISNVNPPKLIIASPVSGNVELGNSSCTFEIRGQVETAGIAKSLHVVRIANANKSDYLKYTDGTYEGWTTEKDGNKVWKIDLPENVEPVGGYRTYEFAKAFNVLTDFGINGTGTKVVETVAEGDQKEVTVEEDFSTENIRNHIFIFRVEDDVGSITEELSLQGDVEKPLLTIDNVTVVHTAGASTSLDLTSEKNTLSSYVRDAYNNITDYIYYSGTWNDNLVSQWNGDTSKIGKIYLYNSNGILKDKDGNKVIINLFGSQKDANGNYTWKTNDIRPEDSTIVNIQALLSDWGGSTTKTSASYFVSSCPPALVRINSENSAGTYKKDDEIIIVMEYNKKVTFADGTAPSLVLNNKGIAKFLDGNGSSKHRYEYVVGKTEGEVAIANELSVTSINVNGNEWKDSDGEKIVSPGTLTGYNLNEVRKIYIDNDNPRINKITAITGEGHYKADKELYFQAKFNKKVSITDLSKVKLTVNIKGTGKENTVISAVSMPSEDTVLFKYKIAAGDNTSGVLEFVGFEGGTDNIKDVAENSMINFNLKDGNNDIKNASIYVDTEKPAKPVVQGLVDNRTYYSEMPLSFANFERAAAATRYYSLDNGTSWSVYNETPVVKITQNGTYKICAKQIDLAGNESDVSEKVTVKLDKGNLLKAISTVNPDGTYKKDAVLDIVLTFRKKVTVSGVSLLLNINDKDGNSLNRTASWDKIDANDQNKHHFKYVIQESDFCSEFNVTGINYGTTGYILDDTNVLVAGTKEGNTATGNNIVFSEISPLKDSRNIKIVNGKPAVVSVSLTKTAGAGLKERELRITFNSEITKQSETTEGQLLYITFKQERGFEAPAILTESQWNEYGSAVTQYYKETTNGWNPTTGAPDLSTKYVLRYEHDTDKAELVNALQDLYVEENHNITPDTVPVPMGSNYVYVDQTDKSVLVISLKDDYTLPVQGADYTIKIPAQIVENYIGERNDAVYSSGTTNYSVSNTGVETPVIRVNRKNESISGTTITQYPTTTYKVDCQTPDVTLNLKTKTATPKYVQLINNDGDNVIIAREAKTGEKLTAAPEFGIQVSELTSAVTIAKKEEKTIGATLNNTTTNNTGYKILIEATASKSSVSSLPAYESAMRTIIMYVESDGNIMSAKNEDRNYPARWIRGGDNTSGGVSTADFPLTWDSSDYNNPNRTVRAMTQWPDTTNTWYWVSWNINTTAYVHFLAGNIPGDAEAKGPSSWWWSACAWTGMKTQTPAYAGECTIFPTNANSRYGGFQYLSDGTDGEKHRESR